MRAVLLLLGLGLPACFSIPSPLAPNYKGPIGAPSFGVQTAARELPIRGEGYERYRATGSHYWGYPELVQALERVARRLQNRRSGPPLLVGDISARNGGRLPGHASHRNGRDVDLLLFVVTPTGAPLKTPGFVRIGADGLGQIPGRPEFVRLDVPRQWQLVRELLTSPEIAVQFLFVSREIEGLLIDYAISRGEPLELLWRAETVLLEPRDSMPHDDHMHLRVACAPEDVVTGCSGGGPRWEWLPPEPKLVALDASQLSELTHDDPPPSSLLMARSGPTRRSLAQP